ncbi:HAD hydrolase family protein [Microbacterium barkeri]
MRSTSAPSETRTAPSFTPPSPRGHLPDPSRSRSALTVEGQRETPADGGHVSGLRREAIDARAVVTDFDGVHTDDTAFVDADGREFVRVSRSDGMGVSLLRRAGIPFLILSTETNGVVAARARKLRVDVRQGLDDKAAALREWADAQGVALADVAYLGNDVNDLPCLRIVGWPVAVPRSHPDVLAIARVVLHRAGGDGAVRELAERVLRSRTGLVPERAGAALRASIPSSSQPEEHS